MSDHISIPDLVIHLPTGLGPSYSAFGISPAPACPIVLSLRIDMHDGIVQGDDDTMLGLGVNYSTVSKDIYARVTGIKPGSGGSFTPPTWEGHEELMRAVAAVPLALTAVKGVQVGLTLERAALYGKYVRYTAYYDGSEASERRETSIECNEINVVCVVGLHPHERKERQRLELDLKVEPDVQGLSTKGLVGDAVEYLEQSSYGTIESLSHSLAEHLLERISRHGQAASLTLTIRKPSAQPFAVPSITITRSVHPSPPSAAPAAAASSSSSSSASGAPRVFLALGSNIEPRLTHIQRAVRALQSGGCTLVGTGKLYESEPMYHLDQSRFLNSAIEVQTSLAPMELLRLLKRVERQVGREKTFENGPRVVDVDLIYHGDEIRKDGKKGDQEVDGVGWLQVPHWGRCEREFVLRPLCDVDPRFIDPILRVPIASMLARLPSEPPQLAPVIPFPAPTPLLRLDPSATPIIMGIFNATPDSFSDGSASRTSAHSALAEVAALFDRPFPPSILDIGGMSTRPNSTPCTEQEELERVVPLIRAIRSSGQAWANVPISVDTYRPSVARAAVEAGASSINDVRGGREEGMLEVMAELDVPVFLMHSRGDSSSMGTAAMQDYGKLGVVEGVRREMVHMVREALAKGVKRWNVILDPGLGFAKSPEDSLVLLRSIEQLSAKGTELEGYPVLVGASRKGFVGKVIARETPAERGYGDAAVASWCAAKKVEVLRVHDTRAAGEVLAMHRAISQAGA